MRVAIRHVTRFHFGDRTSYSIHDVRLQPQPGTGQRLLSWNLRGPGRRHDWVDAYGNAVATFTKASPHVGIEIVAEGIYESSGDASWIGFPDADAFPAPFWLINRGLARHDTPLDPLLADLPQRVAQPQERIGALHDLAGRIEDRIAYRSGASHVGTTALEALAAGEGVCQDHAHVFVACCRRLGVPARYVSGYLRPDAGYQHGSASFAWAEAWVADLGWVGFDPANRCSPTPDYIRLAVGPDYVGAAPITGRRIGAGAEAEMDIEVSVHRVG